MGTRSGLKRGALLSFVMLGLFADTGGAAMVSQTRLAHDTGVTDRTIRNHVRRWESVGLLASRARLGPRGLTLYQLPNPTVEDLDRAGVGPGRAYVALSRDRLTTDASGITGKTWLPDRQALLPTKAAGKKEGSNPAFDAPPLRSASARKHQKNPSWLVPSQVGDSDSSAKTQVGPAFSPRGSKHVASPQLGLRMDESSPPTPKGTPASLPTIPIPVGPVAPELAKHAVREALAWMRDRSGHPPVVQDHHTKQTGYVGDTSALGSLLPPSLRPWTPRPERPPDPPPGGANGPPEPSGDPEI